MNSGLLYRILMLRIRFIALKNNRFSFIQAKSFTDGFAASLDAVALQNRVPAASWMQGFPVAKWRVPVKVWLYEVGFKRVDVSGPRGKFKFETFRIIDKIAGFNKLWYVTGPYWPKALK